MADYIVIVAHIIQRIVKMLCEDSRRSMLSDYFSLNISQDGLVESLPLLLRDYTPNLDKLPLFLMRLGPQVSLNSSFLPYLAYYLSLLNYNMI